MCLHFSDLIDIIKLLGLERVCGADGGINKGKKSRENFV